MPRDAESAKKNVRLSVCLCVCLSVCPSDNSSKSEPILMNLFLKDGLSQAKFEGEHNRSSRSGDMGKKVGKKVVKKCQNGVPERFFEKISRDMTDTEKIMMTNIIVNFVADNIVFEVSKIGPLDPEIWTKNWSK